MTRFGKLAIAATTAISLAAAPISASAAPDGEDIARTLAGLAILGIVAKAASDRKDRRARVSRESNIDYGRIEDDRYDRHDRYDRYDGRRIIRGDIERDGFRRGPKDERGYKRAALPERCLLTVDTGRREFLAYGSRCLERNYKFTRKLPRDCQWQVRTDRGIRSVYGARCLRRDGWRVAGY